MREDRYRLFYHKHDTREKAYLNTDVSHSDSLPPQPGPVLEAARDTRAMPPPCADNQGRGCLMHTFLQIYRVQVVCHLKYWEAKPQLGNRPVLRCTPPPPLCIRRFMVEHALPRSLSDIDRSTAANDPRLSASFSARKNPHRIPAANTPPVFPGLAPLIWPHLLRLVTNAMSDRLLGNVLF